jgi:hypothetical protein
MWLEKYLFYGSLCSPTTNHWYLAEQLFRSADIPLGKCLLGSLYNLMHQVFSRLMMNEPIGTISGPWWLLQLWMNLHMQKVVVNDLRILSFPSLNYLEAQEKNLNEEDKFRQCQSFGEAASPISINWSTGQFFRGF